MGLRRSCAFAGSDRAGTPGEWLTNPCAVEADFEKGERCNGELSPPTCHKLYCSKDGAGCDRAQESLLCNEGLRCAGTQRGAGR